MSIVNVVEIILIIFLAIFIYSLLSSGKKLIIKKVVCLFLINIILIGHLSYGAFIEKPSIKLNGQPEINIEIYENYQEQGVNVKYHNKDLSNQIEIQNNIDNSKLGNYIIEYRLKFRNGYVTTNRKINVIDTIAPTIELKGQVEINVPQNSEYIEDGYTATDNYDGNLSNCVTIKKQVINDKQYKLHYTVSDSSNNTTTAIRIINIVKPIKKEDSNKNGTIYLTFDDGPSLDITPKILNILKEENIKATFFVLNYDKNREFLIKRIINEGHSIGIHGYSHDYEKIYKSIDTYMENITKLQNKIHKSTGINTKITRFPGGSSNTISKYYNVGIMSKLTKILINDGYYYYDWNVSSGDAGDVKTKEQVYKNVINGLSKKRANIVLMHDFSNNNKTVDALQDIINYGKQNGYTFDKIIPNDTPMITHKVAN